MGGKAFKGETRRVTKDEVKSTVTWLGSQWPDYKLNKGLNLHESVLGSAGKSDTSGDIDLNLDITAYDQSKVADQLISLLGKENVIARPGNNQIFTSVPVGGRGDDGRVQVDFMFGNYEWQKFSYYSPRVDKTKQTPYRWYWAMNTNDTSCLKGLYRTELLKALVAFNSDWILEEDGEVIARVGPTFFHDKGCVWRYRHRPMRKDGTARVQDFKELTRDEFKEIYPSSMDACTDVIIDPNEVVRMLFNEQHGPEHVQTFEDTWRQIYQVYPTEDQKVIAKIYIERLNSLKVEIPTDVFKQHGLKVK